MNTINFTIENNVAWIKLNRPEAFNSVNAELAAEWISALEECKSNDEIRAVVITGEGKAFCAGQDLKEVTTPEIMPGFEALLRERYTPIVKLISTIEKPFIAAVNGVAAGAGANLALACDIILANEKASFIQAFSAIGLIPDSGGTFNLIRKVGRAKAMAFAMLGDKIGAAEAERLGMIYKYFPMDSFHEEVEKIATKLAHMPTKGLGLTKRAINASWSNSLEEQLALEATLQIEASETDDYHEGVAAFVEKRKPNFKGC